MRNTYNVLLLVLLITWANADGVGAGEPKLHSLPPSSSLLNGPLRTDTPPSGIELVNPAEFCKTDGIFLAWPYWGNQMIGDVALAVADQYLVYMLVHDSGAQTAASNYLSTRGVNMSNVEFIIDSQVSSSSMWIRDYGPWCILEDGEAAIVDCRYGTYPSDDDIPATIAAFFGLPYYETSLLHHGGNHITDGNGMGFGSTNLWNYNPGWSEEDVRDVFRNYLGIDSLVVVEPMQGDLTGHIDMFCKLMNDSLFIVGEYARPEDGYPGDYALLNDLADYLGSLHNLDGRPFSVARMPMGPWDPNGPYCALNRTHTNAQIINDKVLVPLYGFESDSLALATYEDLMPGYEIIGIGSEFIIQYAGAVHCMVNSLHSANPLVILHRPLESLPTGVSPAIRFSINPRFADTQASVYYRL
ncbi:agmatine deiminase family protein, partial [Candidatus Eisenbacteria bacterium]